MASTFKFHSGVNEVVPWQATYSFPTQATKINKQTVKLPPKNGATFTPGQIVRIEFPADNYLNALNSVLAFDVSISEGSATAGSVRMQRSGAHSFIKRLRVLYGSLVIEDIQEYKTLVRLFTELGVQQDYAGTSGGILDGMAASYFQEAEADAFRTAGSINNTFSYAETLTRYLMPEQEAMKEQLYNTYGVNALRKRTFCLNLLSGLLTCKKLIPLKWMASQLAIEITLADAPDALLSLAAAPSYTVDNVNFIAEMLDFDSTYDAAFFMGLSQGGVPLKFSSWHFHSFALSGTNQILQIHERSRSVKAAFAVIRDQTPSHLADSDRFYHDAGASYNSTTGFIQNSGNGQVQTFQWRVGGRYYPSQPVSCLNGGSEAYIELLKTINALGSYIQASRIKLPDFTVQPGNTGSGSRFIMGCEFENVDVTPEGSIAGINAEEQSDIALQVSLSGSPVSKRLDVFIHYDTLLIVREGNVVDLVM